MKTKIKGFTLIELLIVVVIIALLAAIAIPAYQGYAVRAKRADAKQALLTIQLLQEKWRASNTTYGSNAQLGLANPYVTDNYSTLVSGTSATGYTVTATPIGSQLAKDTECANFVTNQSNSESISGTGSAATCWNR